MYIALLEKRWVSRVRSKRLLKKSGLRFNSARGMPIHATIVGKMEPRKRRHSGGDSGTGGGCARLSPDNEKFHRELANAYTAALRPADRHEKEMEISKLLRARVPSSTSPHQVAAPEQ